MSYEPEDLTESEAYDALRDLTGQSYYLPGKACEVLAPFADHVTDEFAERYECEDYPDLAFAEAIADKQTLATDARGIPTVMPWQPIITGQEISEILVEALGEEPSEGRAVGAGFSADEAHDGNLSTITDVVLDDVGPDAEAEG